jgi:hypothetical protein
MKQYNRKTSILCREKTRKIISIVNEFYQVNCLEFSRRRAIVIPRQIAIYYAYKETSLNTTSVGLLFNKDHATVLHSVNMVESMMKFDPKFKRERKSLEDKIFIINFKTPEDFKLFQLKEDVNKIVNKMKLDKLTELKESLVLN